MASHAQRGDLDKTVPRSASVTTTASVCRPLESVSAALDSQESGKSNFCFKFQGTDSQITESKQFVFHDTYLYLLTSFINARIGNLWCSQMHFVIHKQMKNNLNIVL